MLLKNAQIYVVDSQSGARDRMILALKARIREPCVHASGESFLDSHRSTDTGCLISAHGLSGISGTELITKLSSQQSSLSTILTVPTGTFECAVEAFRCGAFDIMAGPIAMDYLLERVSAGLKKSAALQKIADARSAIRKCYASLSPRERQVLTLVAAGTSNKVVAHELGISEKTVETHRSRSMHKMEAANPLDLARKLILLDLPQA